MAKKKKYHQGMLDRMHESRGMIEHEVKEREMYAGYDERRAQESRDYHMISEDKHAMANLPQQVIMREFPRFKYGLDPYLDDTISGVDNQMYADDHQMKKHISKSKY